MDPGKLYWSKWWKGLSEWMQPIEVKPHKHFYRVTHSNPIVWYIIMKCDCGHYIDVDRQSLKGHMMPQLNYAVDIRGVAWH